MKSYKYSVVVCALGLLVSPLVQAQDQSNRGEKRGRGGESAQSQGRGQVMSADARVEQLDRALTLTPDQKTKIKAIYARAQDEMREAMRGGGRDQQANREKLQERLQATRAEVRALLTDEQKKKFDAMPQTRGGDPRGRGQESRGQESRGAKKR